MKWTLILLLGSFLAETTLGWTYHHSNPKTMNWTDARKWCQTGYTDMVVIQNQAENDYLVSILPNRTGSPYYWIGITKNHKNETWTWIGNNSTWIGNKSWAPTEPNNNFATEFCVEIYVNSGVNRGKWNDEKCGNLKYAVCYKAQCDATSCDRGRCQETIENITCICEPGFEGDRCQTAVQCPALQELENGFVSCGDDDDMRFSYGNTCSFSCEAGFDLQGAHTIRCSEDGQWSKAIPTCKAIGCPAPKIPTSVQISCSPSLSSPLSTVTPHPLGMVCTFSCDEGHELQGALSMECAHLGQWTSTAPNCTAMRCPLLKAPENGRINCSASEPVYNSQCSFTCNQDYSLKGHELLNCDHHGNWTGEQPTCQAPSSPVSAIASGVATGGAALLSGLSLVMWDSLI